MVLNNRSTFVEGWATYRLKDQKNPRSKMSHFLKCGGGGKIGISEVLGTCPAFQYGVTALGLGYQCQGGSL